MDNASIYSAISAIGMEEMVIFLNPITFVFGMESRVKEKLEKGAVIARVIQEVMGKPKDHVEEALVAIVKAIKQQHDMEVLNTTIFPAEEKEKGVYVGFAEMEIMFKDLPRLIGFCFDFNPGSVEVVEPGHFDFSTAHMNDLLNDLVIKLHHTNVEAKGLKIQNEILRKRGTELLRNMVLLAVGNKQKNIDEISKTVGIPSEQLKSYVEVLVKEKKISEKEGIYSLTK